jgi:hypothetical protein
VPILIDKTQGSVTLIERPRSVLDVLRLTDAPLSAQELAARIKPGAGDDRAAVQRARRALNDGVANGEVARIETPSGNDGPDRQTFRLVTDAGVAA